MVVVAAVFGRRPLEVRVRVQVVLPKVFGFCLLRDDEDMNGDDVDGYEVEDLVLDPERENAIDPQTSPDIGLDSKLNGEKERE